MRPASGSPTSSSKGASSPQWDGASRARPCSTPPAASSYRACVADAGVMRRALEYARALPGAVVAQHAEDPSLAAGGHMHEGAWSSRLGIPGRPEAAEAAVVGRDVLLAELTGTPVHFLHLSTAAAVDLVRDAKDRGVPVT